MLKVPISRQARLQGCSWHQKPSCCPRLPIRHSGDSHRHAMPQHNSDPQKPSQPQLDENGSSEGLRKASPDVLRLFSETQRNLLELNRSRLSALDELRVANHKISDLEGKLEKVSNKTVSTSRSSHSDSQHQNGRLVPKQTSPLPMKLDGGES
ncbi:TPA: hypothetical protein ACH3X3_006711 [Trebouxia sp. C0006]